MKPFEEEINDAIRRKLQSSLKDFESKPDADVDRKMYQILKKTPTRKQPYMVWGWVGLLVFVGATVLTYKNQFQSDKPTDVTGNRQQNAAMINPDTLTDKHAENKVQSAVKLNKRSGGYSVQMESSPNSKALDRNTVVEKQNSAKATSNMERTLTLLSGTKKQQKEGRIKTHEKEVTDQIPQQKTEPVTNQYTGVELSAEAQTDSRQILRKSFSDTRERKGYSAGNESPELGTSIKLLSLNSPLVNGRKMDLPEIRYPKRENSASFATTRPDSLHRKFYIDRSALKKVSVILTVTPFHTFQQVSVLSREGSRIQNVGLAGTFSTLGYKFEVGLQQEGFQLLANFSRINTRLNYAYASDEFKVVEKPLKEFEIKRLGVVKSESKSSSLWGVGIKKQIDFPSRKLGRFYTTVGVEYSGFLGQDSGSFLFANLSSGKSFRVHSSTTMSVGPYFEYSFFGRISAADQQIAIRPSQVGLSIQLKLGRDK